MIYLNQYIESSVGQRKNSSQIFKFHVDEGLNTSQCINASANTSVWGEWYTLLYSKLYRAAYYYVTLHICNICTVSYCIVLWNVHTNMREREWHNGPNQFHSSQLTWWVAPSQNAFSFSANALSPFVIIRNELSITFGINTMIMTI